METIINVITAFATACSVIWAIFTYKRSEERRLFAKTRENLSKLKYLVREVDNHLTQGNFSIIANNIVEELKKLKPKEWSLTEFTNFMLDEKNHDLIVESVLVGRLNSTFLITLQKQLQEIDQAIALLREQLPVISAAIYRINFYIESPARASLSTRMFELALGKPDVMRENLVPNIGVYQIESHYFQEIQNYCSSFPNVYMKEGQKKINLASSVLTTIFLTYGTMSDKQLRKSSRKQKSSFSKIENISNEHAIEDGMEYLKIMKSDFTSSGWDLITENKGKILQLMNTD